MVLAGFFIVHASAFQKVITELSAESNYRRGAVHTNENN
jgi:hypothetical protein